MMRRLVLAIALPAVLAACGAEEVWAPDEAVRAAVYRSDQSPSITLITAVNNRSNEGAHSAILINGSQRVLYDPAGSWWHKTVPERNDVLYGMTPLMLEFFIDYHARETYRVEVHEIKVTAEQAEAALRAAEAQGAAPKAFCANHTGQVLRQVPGFEKIGGGFFPGRLKKSFAKLPGVVETIYYDDDFDDNRGVLAAQDAAKI
ncbi:MAG: hypothetical protein VX202_00905 [Pseudomonadota bacterium]|nr:hypothetical protein [Pseudomonadota bacterium]